MVVDIPHGKGRNCWGFRPTEKHRESCCSNLRSKRSITATAGLRAAGCNAPDWSVSHYIIPREKSAPATRPLVTILLPPFVSGGHVSRQRRHRHRRPGAPYRLVWVRQRPQPLYNTLSWQTSEAGPTTRKARW